MKKNYTTLKKLWSGNLESKGLVCYLAHFGNVLPDKATCRHCQDYKEKTCEGKHFQYVGVKKCMIDKVASGDFQVKFTKDGMVSLDFGSMCKTKVSNA